MLPVVSILETWSLIETFGQKWSLFGLYFGKWSLFLEIVKNFNICAKMGKISSKMALFNMKTFLLADARFILKGFILCLIRKPPGIGLELPIFFYQSGHSLYSMYQVLKTFKSLFCICISYVNPKVLSYLSQTPYIYHIIITVWDHGR